MNDFGYNRGMKLIEDIKKAEEKAENLKKKAEIEGQQLLEKEREGGKERFADLDHEKEKLMKRKLADAKKVADSKIAKLDKEHEKNINKLKGAYNKNKEKALKKVQEIVLKWPLSH